VDCFVANNNPVRARKFRSLRCSHNITAFNLNFIEPGTSHCQQWWSFVSHNSQLRHYRLTHPLLTVIPSLYPESLLLLDLAYLWPPSPPNNAPPSVPKPGNSVSPMIAPPPAPRKVSLLSLDLECERRRLPLLLLECRE